MVKKKAGADPVAADAPEPAEDDIRQRAYEIYLERGQQPGSPIDDWLQAEAELKSHRTTT
jgi:hypothetical protein